MTDSPALTPETANKYKQLRATIAGFGRTITAWSGGVDSSLVAFVAASELGEEALAVTSASKSLKRSDLALTEDLAAKWSLKHEVVYTDELTKSEYRANPINRCFHCKTSLYDSLTLLASERDYPYILNGTNVDDLGDHRPGLTAAKNYNIHSPLAELGFHKAEIRELASFLKLDNAHKPQAACLSSRVPYGSHIDEAILAQIENAENVLADLGFSQFRVRHHGDIARIELVPEEMNRMLQFADTVQQRVKACGYRFVAMELGGFKSGSLNVGVIDLQST